jgi:hypothetical protein
MKQKWYQIRGSKWAELWSILHLPYTLMNLSFLSIGFGLTGITRCDVYISIIVAYILGLGLAAHAFDQLPGMGSTYVEKISPRERFSLGLFSLNGGITIGLFWMIRLGAWHLIWIIPLQSIFVLAYPNIKFMGGFFHNDFWFSFSLGFLPVMVGHYFNNLSLNVSFLPWSVLTAIIAGIEITLSRYTRSIRKDVLEEDQLRLLIQKPEYALQLLCAFSYLLAITIILRGLNPV